VAGELLGLAVRGRAEIVLRAEQQAIPQARTAEVKLRTRQLRDRGRGQIIAAGLGARLAKAWKSVEPTKIVDNPRGAAFSKAIYKRAGGFVDLITAYEEGARIAGVQTIPLPTAPRKGNRFARPGDYPRDAIRFGKDEDGTVIVFLNGKPAWVLVRSVTVKRKLNLHQLHDRITAGMDDAIAKRIDRQASAAGKRAAK
jgi:hypothetical protein